MLSDSTLLDFMQETLAKYQLHGSHLVAELTESCLPLWWLLKQLFDKGLLYKGYTIQPYSPAAGTGLSTHELNQPGCYRDVKDTTCTAQFKIIMCLRNACKTF